MPPVVPVRVIAGRWRDEDVSADFQARVMARIPAPREIETSGWMFRTGSAVAAALLVAAFWHPEKSWVRDDRAFASFGINQNPLMINNPFKGGNNHE